MFYRNIVEAGCEIDFIHTIFFSKVGLHKCIGF